MVFRMCGDTRLAEDSAQETFIKAWLNLTSFRAGTSMRNWLYRIGVNAALDALRRERGAGASLESTWLAVWWIRSGSRQVKMNGSRPLS
ncbi:MAG: sigma factor [Bellilinea sp.]